MGYTTDTIRKRLFEVVNFVAATHPKGQKRCRRGDACQITSFDVKTLACGRSFCSYRGRAYEVLLEISGGERTEKRTKVQILRPF